MHNTNFASFSGILARTEIFRENQRGLLRIKRGYLIRLRLNKGTKSTIEPVKAVEYGIDALSVTGELPFSPSKKLFIVFQELAGQ